MVKDRAAPFSRKHRRYWLPVTGGMVLIGVINVIIGYCSYPRQSDEPQQQIQLHLIDAGMDASVPPQVEGQPRLR